MDQTALERLGRQIDSEVKARFPAGAVQGVTLLRRDDDPDELVVRVFIGAEGGPADHQRSLDEWAKAHRTGMRRLRRELSLRLPEASLLEFTIEAPGATARITVPDDPALTSEPLPAREIVETALGLLRTYYVFPGQAGEAAAAIEASLAAGEYDGLDEDALAERLTSQLQEVCHDKHLRVGTVLPQPDEQQPSGGRQRAVRRQRPDRRPWERRPGNFGIYRAEWLDGNVGYLDLRGVADPEEAGPAIAAAMELVAGTDALIIDLRRNHGGSPHGVVFWCSYFFPGGGTHLNDIQPGGTGETRQFWSMAYVPGSRYLDRPVYLLSSAETFSGGEDFCYSMQAQGRAEVIGETTGGGAHPTRTIPISATIAISVPFARSVNPVTGTNWQGTGVVPDTAVPAARAYDVAYRKALEHVLSIGVPPPIAAEARDALAALPPADEA